MSKDIKFGCSRPELIKPEIKGTNEKLEVVNIKEEQSMIRVGKPVILPDVEMSLMLKKFKIYGQKE